MTDTMTKTERGELISLIKQKARVAKAMASQRSAEVLADFEHQMGSIYLFDQDETWAAAHALAQKAGKEAQAAIAERCEELGIPKEFAPFIDVQWYSRGENALNARRTELRRMATTRIDANEKASRLEIDKYSVDLQTQIVAGGLTSDAAKSFLEGMPTIEELMPVLDATEFKGLLSKRGSNDE